MSFDINHCEGNPRNSEGSFIKLADGSLMFIYTRYNGKHFGDPCQADLVSRISRDGGETWSDWKTEIKNAGLNVMSVSLLRMADGRIALAYLRKTQVCGTGKEYPLNKYGEDSVDCRPWICFSEDEAQTWGPETDISEFPPIYLVVNNDRLIQLKSGRLIIPAANHGIWRNEKYKVQADTLFFLSDDLGKTWRESKQTCYPPQSLTSGLREPGVIELSDGRVMAWFRTNGGHQYKAFSSDGGETWTQPVPAYEFPCPESPLSMKMNPETGELFAIWNDADPRWHVKPEKASWGRTPLVLARSTDNGATWHGHTILEDAPDHGFCYIAMLFEGKSLLLAYCCGGGSDCVLQDLRIRRVDI